MLGFVGGTSWFIIYIFTSILGLSGSMLSLTYIVFTALPIALVMTMLIGAKYYSRINAVIYTIVALWVPAFMYIFLVACTIGIGYSFIPSHDLLLQTTKVLFGVAGVLFVYGIYVALHPKVVYYTIKSEKLKEKWGDKKIVLFSDSHLGIVRHKSFMQKIADMVNAENPDVVFIAGDLIDGPVFPYEYGLAPLGKIKSTYGTYYTAGNHDEYNVEQEKYYAVLNKYATVLNDKKIIINDTQLVGVMYAEESKQRTKERLEKTGYDKSVPSIVMLHDPRNRSSLVDSNVSLSLSGHTHGGQFFPVTLLVSLFYGNRTKGVHYIENSAHFTSVGAGTAGPLFRLGTRPEITVVKIV